MRNASRTIGNPSATGSWPTNAVTGTSGGTCSANRAASFVPPGFGSERAGGIVRIRSAGTWNNAPRRSAVVGEVAKTSRARQSAASSRRRRTRRSHHVSARPRSPLFTPSDGARRGSSTAADSARYAYNGPGPWVTGSAPGEGSSASQRSAFRSISPASRWPNAEVRGALRRVRSIRIGTAVTDLGPVGGDSAPSGNRTRT